MSEVKYTVYERLLVLLEARVARCGATAACRTVPGPGRPALMDLWEELADALQYCTQLLLEREASAPPAPADAGGAEPRG